MMDEEILENISGIIESGTIDQIIDVLSANNQNLSHPLSYYLLPILVYRKFPIEFLYRAPDRSILRVPTSKGPIILWADIWGIGDNPKVVLASYLGGKKFKATLIEKVLNQIKVLKD